jgi:hypothetical protein
VRDSYPIQINAISKLSAVQVACAISVDRQRELLMPRYFFDIKDGRRIVDPSGLDCLEDTDLQGETLARQIEADGSVDMDPRHVVVINAEVQQIGKIAVQRAPVGRTEKSG